MVGICAKMDIEHTKDAAHDETRGDDDDDGERYLGNQERRTQALA